MQGQFDFDSGGKSAGYKQWLAGRQLAALELARRMNLPIGHDVEVWLTGGVRLCGRLRLQEEVMVLEEDQTRHLALRIGRATFTLREIEACVRLD